MNNFILYKLDLHGTFHKDVRKKVDKFINKCILEKALEVEVVTGHSDRMKELVNEVLDEYNLKGVTPIFNNGTLLINMLIKL
ncbi:MAG: hypothetical protein ACI8PF_000430 [Flavobacteriaceae bacterium]|jgi:hypothetical protein|tara:strand:+ start:2057 stop:2302 length:246 start_codon:yes stop_codon:yes gene_type:complete